MACIALASLFSAARVEAAPAASNRVTADRFVVEPATLQALGFEWYVKGDDNRNAVVAVSYRKRGEHDWKDGQPLIRLDREHNKGPGEFVAPNVFVGSLFDLEPGAEYECRFMLSDPDGVSGIRQKNSHGPYTPGTHARSRRPRLSRLSARESRPVPGAGLLRPVCRMVRQQRRWG